MASKIEDDWDFYLAYIENKPASFQLNLGLHNHAPIDKLVHLVQIQLGMLSSKPNGLSSSEEAETLYAIEDLIIPLIAEKSNTLYVGRITANGTRDFFFYSKNKPDLSKVHKRLESAYPQYSIEGFITEDAEWRTYLDFLYPAPEDMQRIQNRRVVDELEKNGDKSGVKRKVFHFIYFPDSKARETFITKIQAKGYGIENMSEDMESELPFGLQISREDTTEIDTVDEYTLELWSLASDIGGDYDGWETSVET